MENEPIVKKSRRKSAIWINFIHNDSKRATCRKCGHSLSTAGGSLSNLTRHWNIKHRKKIPDKILEEFPIEEADHVIGANTEITNEEETPNYNIVIGPVGKNDPDEGAQPQSNGGSKKNLIRRSPIWIYFTEFGPNRGKCNLCGSVISTRGGSTSNLRRHLRNKHKKIIMRSRENSMKLPTKDTQMLGGVPEEMIVVQNCGEEFPAEVLFHEFDDVESEEIVSSANTTANQSSTMVWQTKRPNILRQVKNTRHVHEEIAGDHNEANANSSQNDNTTKLFDNSKVGALKEIAHNLGRIATCFERFAGFICNESGGSNERHSLINDRARTRLGSRVNELILKVLHGEGDNNLAEEDEEEEEEEEVQTMRPTKETMSTRPKIIQAFSLESRTTT